MLAFVYSLAFNLGVELPSQNSSSETQAMIQEIEDFRAETPRVLARTAMSKVRSTVFIERLTTDMERIRKATPAKEKRLKKALSTLHSAGLL